MLRKSVLVAPTCLLLLLAGTHVVALLAAPSAGEIEKAVLADAAKGGIPPNVAKEIVAGMEATTFFQSAIEVGLLLLIAAILLLLAKRWLRPAMWSSVALVLAEIAMFSWVTSVAKFGLPALTSYAVRIGAQWRAGEIIEMGLSVNRALIVVVSLCAVYGLFVAVRKADATRTTGSSGPFV